MKRQRDLVLISFQAQCFCNCPCTLQNSKYVSLILNLFNQSLIGRLRQIPISLPPFVPFCRLFRTPASEFFFYNSAKGEHFSSAHWRKEQQVPRGCKHKSDREVENRKLRSGRSRAITEWLQPWAETAPPCCVCMCGFKHIKQLPLSQLRVSSGTMAKPGVGNYARLFKSIFSTGSWEAS